MAGWLPYLDDVFPEAAARICERPPKLEQSSALHFLSESDLPTRFPDETAKLLLSMMPGLTIGAMWFWEPLRNIIAALRDAGIKYEVLKLLCDQLARLEYPKASRIAQRKTSVEVRSLAESGVPMAKIEFYFKKPDLTIVRHVVVQRLREDASWNQLDSTGDGFLPYVEMQGPWISQFACYASEVCWHLLTTSVLAPGFDPSNERLPFFHLTAFGRRFVKTGDWPVYDESEYLGRLGQLSKDPDRTVIAYLTESLRSFERGNFVAASVMLGIGAERVFLLLCEATLKSLSDGAEKATFGKLIERYPIKPKLDWLHAKFGELQKSGPPGFPDNVRA